MASISASVRPEVSQRLNPVPASSGTPSAAYWAPLSSRAAATRRSSTDRAQVACDAEERIAHGVERRCFDHHATVRTA